MNTKKEFSPGYFLLNYKEMPGKLLKAGDAGNLSFVFITVLLSCCYLSSFLTALGYRVFINDD